MNFMKIGTNNAHYFLMKNTIDIKSHIESLAKKSLIGNHGEIFAKIYKENEKKYNLSLLFFFVNRRENEKKR